MPAPFDNAYASNFEINIPGYTDNIPIFSVEQLATSVEVIASIVGNLKAEQLSCPQTGPRKPEHIVITAFANTDTKPLYDWFNAVNPVGKVGADLAGNLQPPQILACDSSNNPVLTIDLIDAHPFSIEYEGLDSNPASPVKLKMTIACSDIDVA